MISLAVGGLWWVATNEARYGDRTILGILPWARGGFVGALLVGLVGEAWPIVVAMLLTVVSPGVVKPDSDRPRWGGWIPEWLGRICLYAGEGFSVVAMALALGGLLAGGPIGGLATAWAYVPGQTGFLAEFLADSDYEKGWRVGGRRVGGGDALRLACVRPHGDQAEAIGGPVAKRMRRRLMGLSGILGGAASI